MFRFIGWTLVGFVLSFRCYSQPLTAYVNLQNQLIVWDDGMIRKIDYLPPMSMKIGRTAIPYLDNSRAFKIYYGGGVHKINVGFTNNFFATDNLVAYLNAKSLNVFEGGKMLNLTRLTDQYLLGDSILLFHDGIQQEYKAYYAGAIYPIENFLAARAIAAAKVSDNIAAYNNYAGQFRIFYHGSLLPQEDREAENFDVGRNTVAYIDLNRQFKIFHKGKTIVAENFPPESFSAGDDLVAYVSNDGYFKIFYGDSVRTIGFFRANYRVGDRVVVYSDNSGYFNAFYNGDIIPLETYAPDNYVVQYNSVAYVNRSNTLRLFTAGEIYDVSTMFDAGDREGWELSYDVLRYKVGLHLYKVFYKGEEY